MIPGGTDTVQQAGEAGDGHWPSRGRAVWTTALLMLAMIVSYVDRSIIALLVDPIKASLRLTDVEIGLIQGAAFGMVFTVMMFPVGWLADNFSRMRLVGTAVAFWSVMTATCGLATNVTQLFLARMGVAMGEASLGPTAPSIIADSFPPERRTLPLSLYATSASAGISLSLLIGGALAALIGDRKFVEIPGLGQFEPWQVIFFVVALPGLLVSLLFFVSREPVRSAPKSSAEAGPKLLPVLLEHRRVLLPHIVGYGVFQIFSYSVASWLPAFFMRVHGWSVAEVGLQLGLIQLGSGIAGALIGGATARALWRRGGRNADFVTAALFIGLTAAPAIAGMLVPNYYASSAFVGLMLIGCAACVGPMLAGIQDVVPGPVRARVTAIYYIVLGLVGLTLGPLAIGLMNDKLFVDPQSVGKSLALAAVVLLPLSCTFFALAARQRGHLGEQG